MKISNVIVAAVTSLMIGCSARGPSRPLTLAEGRTLQFVYTDPKQTNFFRHQYAGAKDKRLTRNEIIDDLKGLINQNYRDYEVELRSDKNLKDLFATLATLGLTTAATITGGEATKSIMSAIATGIVGANAATDHTIFRDFGLEAIRFEMRRLRAEREQLINEGKKKSVDQYTLNQALDDLIEYYNAGFVTRALDSLVLSAGTNAVHAQSVTDKQR